MIKKIIYYTYKKNSKQALNHGLKLTKVHTVIKSNKKYCLKQHIDINTEPWTNTKNNFQKYFFKFMNNSVFGKVIENVGIHRDIKIWTIDKRTKYLVSEANYHTTKLFSEKLLVIKMKNT